MAGRRIAGVVLGEDGAQVAGVTVRLASVLTKSGLRPESNAVTDGAGRFDFGAQPPTAYIAVAGQPLQAVTQPDGSFVVDHVFPGAYMPIVDGYRDDGPLPEVTVESTDVTEVVVEVARRAAISGRVLHDGKPVHAARVRAGTSYVWAATDHAGRYTLRGVDAGSYRIYAESHRLGAFSQGPSVTVASGGHPTNVDVRYLDGAPKGSPRWIDTGWPIAAWRAARALG